MIGEHVYPYLPIAAQNLACSLYGLRERRARMGRFFWPRYRALLESERWSRQRLSEYQDAEIARLIAHVYANVPFYRRRMNEIGLVPSDVVCRADLQKLPILTKEDVVLHARELVSVLTPTRTLRKGATSGTTGKALSFFTTEEAVSFQWAVWWRHRARFGCEPFQWHINFTGKQVVPIGQQHPPYWRWNRPMRQALVGMQHVTPQKVRSLLQLTADTRFVYYSGYPSIIASFCELLLEQSLALTHRPKYIFLGAEGVQERQREVMEQVTQALVTDQYGFSEGCGNASQCEHGAYHEDSEFGVLECHEGEAFSDGRVRGRIVATGFSNYVFPFLRYEVGDVAVWMPPEYRCPCGRESLVIERIEGRDEDYVVTPEGMRVMRFDYLFKGTYGVKEAQVVQREPGAIVIRIVPRPTFSVEDEKLITEKIRDLVSPTIRVEYDVVTEIPKGRNGKFRAVVSELSSGK